MTSVPAKRRSNLRDVAALAKVSVATVSRVLNDSSTVSQQTRDRVQAAIDELRFVRSAAARAINSGRTRIVGALVPTLDNAIFARFLDALERQLMTHQLSLIVATTNEDPDAEAEKASHLIDIGAEGLIVSGINHSDAFMQLIERTDTPVIATSYVDPKNRLPTIGYDNYAAGEMAVRHLSELGHRRIAVLHGPVANNDRTRARLTGARRLENDHDLEFIETTISMQGGQASVDTLLERRTDRTAILCLSDVIAMGALFGLQRANISVPDRMSLMGVDDLPGSAIMTPPLTTIALPVQDMGRVAAESLARWIEAHEKPAVVELGIALKIRSSTGPPAAL